MVHFSTINHISMDQPHTWAKKVFLTLDIDWAIDPVIDFTLNLLEKHQCQATIFVTHDSPSVRALMKNPLFEIGIHPNFNDLVNGKKHGTALDQINDILSITGAIKSAPYFFDYKGLLSMVNNASTGVRDLFIDFISQNGQPSIQKVS